MVYNQIEFGNVSEIDAENLLVKVVVPSYNDVTTGWLNINLPSGSYDLPAEGDQVMIAMDEGFNTGAVIAFVNNSKPDFNDAKIIGVQFPGFTVKISKETGDAELTFNGVFKITADSFELTGDTKITGKLEVSDELTASAKITAKSTIAATGNITSQADVKAGLIGLLTHKHPTAGTGPPSPPIP